MLEKKIMQVCLEMGLLVCLFATFTQAQTATEILFPNQKDITQIVIPYEVFKVYAAGEKVAVAGLREPKASGEVILYNSRGQELWRKGDFKGAPYVSLGENSNKTILITDSTLRDERRNICVDENGNTLWEKWVTSPGISQSPDGRYGITTMVSGEEGKGKFQIFELSTGIEIPHPIPTDYAYFYAKFLDSQQVVLLLQQVKFQRDTTLTKQAFEQYRKLMREGRKNEIGKLVLKTKMGWKEPLRRLTLVIYDIINKTVIVQRELVSRNGRSFYVSSHYHGNLSTSPNGEYIAIAGMNLPWEERKTAYPYVVQMLDSQGNLLWERGDFDLISDTRFVEDKLVILDGMRIRVFDVERKEEIGNFDAEGIRRGRDVIQEAILQNNKLIVQCSGINDFRVSTLLILDLSTGEFRADLENPGAFVLVWKKGTKGVVLNKGKRLLSFIQ
ncbi:MAG: hypothetical protein J7K33_01230 [Candidatus Marinimicrobia bacterium]|nr:hypothetical protein [Candidatus Neomarinimicrobiota bacterium]